jgi:hypothetical protein
MSVHYGLPYSLFLCFAATSNLRCDMSSMDPGLVKLKAARIERYVVSSSPLLSLCRFSIPNERGRYLLLTHLAFVWLGWFEQ